MSMIENQVVEEASGNSLFSPVSILTTLNMLLLGTTGETRQEIIRSLGKVFSFKGVSQVLGYGLEHCIIERGKEILPRPIPSGYSQPYSNSILKRVCS